VISTDSNYYIPFLSQMKNLAECAHVHVRIQVCIFRVTLTDEFCIAIEDVHDKNQS
jgi:hypothetical protein